MKQFVIGAGMLLSVLTSVSLTAADVIIDWNEKAVTAGYAARVTPNVSARQIAMVHIAMFEALNSIEPRYTPYRGRLAAEPNASRDAAAADAAHHILTRAYPEQDQKTREPRRPALCSRLGMRPRYPEQ